MHELPTNNDQMRAPPDPHGQAAMLAVESLLHTLVAKAVLSLSDAIDIVETAVSVQEDFLAESDEENEVAVKSLAILQSISKSLSHDLKEVK